MNTNYQNYKLSDKHPVKYVGWVPGTEELIPKLREFGFTGEMKAEVRTYTPSSQTPTLVVETKFIGYVAGGHHEGTACAVDCPACQWMEERERYRQLHGRYPRGNDGE